MKRLFLDLGVQPLANELKKKFFTNFTKYRLQVFFDTKTKIVFLKNIFSSKEMFTNKYPYKSSGSTTMIKSFSEISSKIKKRFKFKNILEIGSNDGAFAKNFDPKNIICIEPCKNLAIVTKKLGYQTYANYFDKFLVSKFKKKKISFDIIYSANTLTHIPRIKEVIKNCSSLMSDDGILIIEDPSLLSCIKNLSYDQFYNEHIYVLSCMALKNICKSLNLQIFDVEKIDTHGGTLRYFIKKKKSNLNSIKPSVLRQISLEKRFNLNKFSTYRSFGLKVNKSKNRLKDILNKLKIEGKRIIGYGATAKSTTVIHFCNLQKNIFDYFLDTTADKINKFIPGTMIRIKKYKKIIYKNDLCVFLGAWNFKKEIFKKEINYLKKGGLFITHVPYPRIINK